MNNRIALLGILLPTLAFAEIKVGIIGTDTSHVPAFTRLLNDPSRPDHVPGAKVVAAYPGGSDDVESSYTRVKKYAAELRDEWGVEIVDDIPTLCSKVDAILLESVDGRKHLEQVKPVFEAGKPVFIDKPLAASLEDVWEIARLGKKHQVPWFSASSLRYVDAVADAKVEGLRGAATWGPASIHPTHHLDLSWYAVHPIELLYTMMGPGCVSVHRTHTAGADVIVGLWKDGRIGTVRGIREGKRGYGVIAYGEDDIKSSSRAGGAYARLLVRVVEFFRTGEPPVPNDVTIEIFSFMDAALRSKDRGGAPVKLR